ncbi:dihydrolipoamide acetyltransferase family protein [Paenibacillus lutrae]|uniref:Dihydrolipoamide acetyltransferase component of pyruvate dehydrogenase complex n=1 Tax=Paenibacillus lutrae TaxID=2078573 RepID=A0A7X3JZN3_9BACL|nr:dihydrolipoamide acetyltransferase family protein [Paenibacillus lutrae]MVP00126.1 2-oxo acid dehydrogenase subunit E2 [Paenibacillus lutrae]
MSEINSRLAEVPVPHLAESLVSATVGTWLKQPGDYIQQYDVLCELYTDKVNVEMPSPIEGRLIKILVGNGETAAVGDPICLIELPESSAGSAAVPAAGGNNSPAERAGAHNQSGEQGGFTARPSGANAQPPHSSLAGGSGDPMRARYSPAVLRLAAEHNLDLGRVTGTGMGGRITRKDVEMLIARGEAPGAGQGAAAPAHTSAPVQAYSGQQPSQVPPQASVDAASIPGYLQGISDAYKAAQFPVRSSGIHLSQHPATPLGEMEERSTDGRGDTYIDVTPVRNTIASRMRQSVSEIPHAWTMIEVDVTNLVTLRSKSKDDFMKREGINLTYLPFLLKAVVNAIKDYPIMNSVWAVDKIIIKRDINLALAVGTEESVLTPVIKKADQMNIAGLAREADMLSKKARTGRLSLDDLQGGTFTVNNTGSFGSILSKPIINYPQAAILTFESIVKKPVVIQDMIAVRSMVNICLSLDHRILDGVICGRFLQRVKENMEGYDLDTKLY